MSRHWSEYKYINAQILWDFIDQQTIELEMISDNENVKSSELCKLFLFGRREMIDAFTQYLSDNEELLGDIATNRHGIITREDLISLIKKEYGA